MKAPPHLDFVQPRRIRFWGAKASFANRLAATVTLIVSTVGLILSATTLWKSVEEEDHVRQRVVQLQTEVEALKTGRPTTLKTIPQQDIERLERIIHQLNLPWADVLSTLEELRPDGVAMVSMEPAGSGSLRVQIESLSLDRLLAYAAALQSTGPFGSLIYIRHETNERDANQPVRLSFELTLKGRGGRP